MENTIPTAEEFLNTGLSNSGFELSGQQLVLIAHNAKALIKLHVQAALKEASENAEIKIKDDYSESYSLVKSETVNYNSQGVYNVYSEECTKHTIKIDEESILNAYPLYNIK